MLSKSSWKDIDEKRKSATRSGVFSKVVKARDPTNRKSSDKKFNTKLGIQLSQDIGNGNGLATSSAASGSPDSAAASSSSKHHEQITKDHILDTCELFDDLMDNGFALSITQEGSGQDQAATGVEVSLEYLVSVWDASSSIAISYASSKDDDQPLTFIVGNDEVPSGLDKAVVGLTVGTKGTVTITPEQAYGEAGTDDVPPNTHILYEFEVVGVKPMHRANSSRSMRTSVESKGRYSGSGQRTTSLPVPSPAMGSGRKALLSVRPDDGADAATASAAAHEADNVARTSSGAMDTLEKAIQILRQSVDLRAVGAGRPPSGKGRPTSMLVKPPPPAEEDVRSDSLGSIPPPPPASSSSGSSNVGGSVARTKDERTTDELLNALKSKLGIAPGEQSNQQQQSNESKTITRKASMEMKPTHPAPVPPPLRKSSFNVTPPPVPMRARGLSKNSEYSKPAPPSGEPSGLTQPPATSSAPAAIKEEEQEMGVQVEGAAENTTPEVEKRDSVSAWLADVGLSQYASALADIGLDSISDFSLVEKEDLDDLGMKKLHKRKLLVNLRQRGFDTSKLE